MRDLFLLDPDVVFLNHGSFGACPRPVFERYRAWQLELEREPVEFLDRRRGFGERFDRARRRLAAYVGADPGNLVFAPNTSTALDAVARSLRLAPGDEILLGDDEYGGILRLWSFVAARTGAHLRSAPFDELDPNEQTRVVHCSHVEWSSGRVNDVAEACRRARDAGALSVVDGAHAPGQVDLALDELGADVYAGNCHKWLCSPKGAAFLYARPDAQPLLEPLVVSWGWDESAPWPEQNRWQGTRDPAAYLTVPAAIDFQAEHDWPAVRARSRRLLEHAREQLRLEPLTDRFVQMLGFAIDVTEPERLTQRLFAEHRIEVPVFETAHGWVLRVSIQAYNDEEDVEALVRALHTLQSSRAGRRSSPSAPTR
ncbi:MAG TPA: aminotransferase class V-fold PLP-dependent enzyme [Gaiellaceae bacterium]